MKKCFMKAVMCGVAVLFALTLASLPSWKVSADSDADINLNGTVAIDLESDSTWWIKYVATEGKMVEITSSGSTSVKATLYMDTKNGSVIAKDYSFGLDGLNFRLTSYLKEGTTYYLKVEPGSGTISARNNTKVTFKDVTDDSLVASVDETNFPDANFRAYVSEKLDLSKDGLLTKDEVKLVAFLNLQSKQVSSLEGIGYFSELTSLHCGYNSLSALDLSGNINLEQLDCNNNSNLESLNISGCKKLKYLSCYKCNLSSLELSGSPALSDLNCYGNTIKKLDLSNNQCLTELRCEFCNIDELKISNCKDLKNISCYKNNLTFLDLSSFGKLETVECSNNKIETLKINDGIRVLDFRANKVKEIDISKCSNLQKLLCTGNEITDLDISGCPFLDYISQGEPNNHYKGTVDGKECELSFDKDVTLIHITDPSEEVVQIIEDNFPSEMLRNVISVYDLDNDTWLDKLEIRMITDIFLRADNGLCDSLKGIEYFTELKSLTIANHIFETLDLSNNPKLKSLMCNNCQMTSLNLSNNKELTTLYCFKNSLTKLDLKNNIKLTELRCEFNDLSSLDLSANKDLKYLCCYGNKMNTLDLTENSYLADAYKKGEKTTAYNLTCKYDKYIYQGKKYSELSIDSGISVVTEKPVSLTLDKKEASVVCGKTLTLKATLKNSTSSVTWKSSNTKIATVDSKGKVTAKMAGKVTITATAAGKSAKCTVTVLYKDVTNSSDFWYAPTNYLTAKGVVRGYANQTEFRPANNCTRAQMVTFLYRLQGEPATKSNKCKFDDVKDTDYFYKPVIWATEKGITTGVSAKEFAPQKVCTRAQTVTFLWRMAGKPAPGKNAKKFTDVEETAYYYKATLWASDMKILAGYDDGTFKPDGKCLRRQMVTFLYKYDKYVNGKG